MIKTIGKFVQKPENKTYQIFPIFELKFLLKKNTKSPATKAYYRP
jgi:hypothetical protein